MLSSSVASRIAVNGLGSWQGAHCRLHYGLHWSYVEIAGMCGYVRLCAVMCGNNITVTTVQLYSENKCSVNEPKVKTHSSL